MSILEIMKYKFHQQVFKCRFLAAFVGFLNLIFAATAAAVSTIVVVLLFLFLSLPLYHVLFSSVSFFLSLQCTSHPPLSADKQFFLDH